MRLKKKKKKEEEVGFGRERERGLKKRIEGFGVCGCRQTESEGGREAQFIIPKYERHHHFHFFFSAVIFKTN